jgi:acyl-CoA synthetase (AMP-forming)/AMP-acid ligase II
MVAKNYLTTFLDRAYQQPSQLAITYLRRGEFEDASFTYQELADAGRSWARGFLDTHDSKEPVLLVYPPGPEFVVAILGCLFAGVVAAPLPVPRPGESLRRLQQITKQTRFGALISTKIALASITQNREAQDALGPVQMLCHEDLTIGDPTDSTELPGLAINPEQPILVQYSSGSTRAPQGAVLNSRCVVENSELCTDSIRCSDDSCVVSWLPHHHDLGLFGALLYPLMKGLRLVHMAPHAFVQHPVRWLNAISRYRGNISGGPPLGFELCNRSISDDMMNGIDLSSWENVFCGAEPVFSAPMDEFYRRFSAVGLSRRSFSPVYGLAENTAFVAGTNRGNRTAPPPPPASHRREPCLLTTKSRQQIRIVDPDTLRETPPNTPGEIWVHGPCIALGYLTDRLESPSQFHARTEPDDGIDHLRTGDLGLIDGDWLYITGRIKDMLIVNGANVHAADIEWIAAECDPRLNASAAAAFHREDGAHGDVILLIESHQKFMEPAEAVSLGDQIRAKVLAETGAALHTIDILPRSALPKTTSGKVQRNRARTDFLARDDNPNSSPPRPASP